VQVLPWRFYDSLIHNQNKPAAQALKQAGAEFVEEAIACDIFI